MTIREAETLVTAEYNEECLEARKSPARNLLMAAAINREYTEIDEFLPSYVGEIAATMGAPQGMVLPDYVYQAARMAFRLGMRVQRKIDQPDIPTTIFWEPGVTQ
jgi:hypothetical protein